MLKCATALAQIVQRGAIRRAVVPLQPRHREEQQRDMLRPYHIARIQALHRALESLRVGVRHNHKMPGLPIPA
jgi:hypothetical protein